jgi:predicted ATP-grasp superfamily ATP-dependent carboligase
MATTQKTKAAPITTPPVPGVKTIRHPTVKEKVAVYESMLHSIQMHAVVNMNPAAVQEMINRICAWSYAHRVGNGELSDKQIQERVDTAFWRFDIHKEFEPHTK